MRRSMLIALGLAFLTSASLEAQSSKPTGSPNLTSTVDVTTVNQAREALVRQIGTVSAPPPITSSNWLRGLDLTASQLKAGRTVRYTPEALQNRDGHITIWDMDLLRGRANRYVGHASNQSVGARGSVAVEFDAPPGKRYLVDFAIKTDVEATNPGLPELRRFTVDVETCGSQHEELRSEGGHVALLISRPTSLRCKVSVHRTDLNVGWTFFAVDITPLP